MNKVWHEKNPMPKNPTVDQRIVWHVAHAKYCRCREIPFKLMLEIKNHLSPAQYERLRKALLSPPRKFRSQIKR